MANLGYIQVVRRCNQRCRFCSNPVNERALTLAAGKRLVDGYLRRGYDGVILTGGEPTLYKPLAKLIAYAKSKGMPCRLITNAQLTADPVYLDGLIEAGLDHLHVSVHSHRKEVQGSLTGNPGSLANIARTLARLSRRRVSVDINQTICAQNADHIHLTARWLCERFPYLRHFSWTYLDPLVERVAEDPGTVPTLRRTKRSLLRAMRYLDRSGRTFRLEKVPLCYMGEFGHCSTETRAIVKGEQRAVDFLDERVHYREHRWRYGKAAACGKCSLTSICAGLWDMDGNYDPSELVPQTADPRPIVRRVLRS
jgi:MoaA/NifB/PqqE/SkfB family radical SAM enzyme